MKITREKIVDELMYKVKLVCKEFSNPTHKNNKDNYIAPLPLTKVEMRNILHKIVTALPVDFFIAYPDGVTSAIKEYITKEYILFQAQEDITAEEFGDYLINFIIEVEKNINKSVELEDITLLER